MITEKQRQERQKYIGGSDCAAICGVSPWMTPLDVYLSKVEPLPPEPPIGPNSPMYWGNIMEPKILDEFRKTHGDIIQSPPTSHYRGNDFMAANLDAIDPHGEFFVEAKFTGVYAGWDESAPDYVIMQVHHQALCCRVNTAYVAALVGTQFKILKVEIYQDLLDDILEEQTRFWTDHVLKKVPPEPENDKDLTSLYPSSKNQHAIASDEILPLFTAFRAVNSELKQVKKTADELKFKIKRFMAESDTLIHPKTQNILATWKPSSRESVDAKRFKAENPLMYQEYLNVTNTRALLIK